MNNWIPVAEKMPAVGEDVLVWLADRGEVGMDCFAHAYDVDDPPEFCVYGDVVTHWQPLPGAPAEA